MIDLTVAMCSIESRYRTMALAMQEQLWGQWHELPPSDRARVQILIVTDNKVMSTGAKRNWLVRMASGRYVQFVDDDDRIEEDALAQVLAATEHNCDVIAFPAVVRINGGLPRICRYSKDFTHDHEALDGYRRLPNHICAVKRDLMLVTPFADICMGEDADYARRLHPMLTSEYRIEKPLYFYDYNRATSESRR